MVKNLKAGDIIGIYEILGESSVRTKDGHKQFHAKCTVCGLEKDLRTTHLGATICNHKREIIPRYCECCGNVIPFNSKTRAADYNLRRFCTVSCAAKVNSCRTHSEESKVKTSQTLLLKYNDVNSDLYKSKLKAKEEHQLSIRTLKNSGKYYIDNLIEQQDYIVCPYCNLRFSQIQASHLKLHNKTFEDLYIEFGKDYKVVSDKTYDKKVKAGKAVQQKLLATGTHKGWQSRNITSYAEQFWMQVLDNNSIEYQREVPVKHDKSNYFLDFVIEHNGKLIDLEIDGKQHTYEDRIQSDVIRDVYLTKQGYLVYRVAWNEVKSKAGVDEMKEKIDAFLTFYNNL
jgi:very-short-patch-repair endonuclease